jgi:site-specific DNA-methyltransferase (adenine-specific)
MAVRIEDAGFEIRDMIAWVYGSGFPKSLDVSKAIDKAAGVQGEYGTPKSAAHAGWIDRGRMRGEEGHEGYQRPWMADAEAVEKNARQYIGGTDAARQWKGWGTALKPAMEPITVARKPLIGTVAENVLAHGTGALNVDGCRVQHGDDVDLTAVQRQQAEGTGVAVGKGFVGSIIGKEIPMYKPGGRWPANLIHDGSEEVVGLFPQTTSGKMKPTHTNAARSVYGQNAADGYTTMETYGDSGSAARFFYCAKASKRDRDEGNNHPTVKPTDLMRYLCRLVTPPNGTILDPFTGSGSTGKAAMLEGFQFIGIEREAEYVEIAKARIEAAKK